MGWLSVFPFTFTLVKLIIPSELQIGQMASMWLDDGTSKDGLV